MTPQSVGSEKSSNKEKEDHPKGGARNFGCQKLDPDARYLFYLLI